MIAGSTWAYWGPDMPVGCCTAFRDKVTSKVFYQRIVNRLAFFSDELCAKCKTLKLNEPIVVERPVMKMLGKDFVNLVCDALGLTSQKIRGVKISADCQNGTTVKVEIDEFVDVDQGKKIAAALKGSGAIVKTIPANPEPLTGQKSRAAIRKHGAFGEICARLSIVSGVPIEEVAALLSGAMKKFAAESLAMQTQAPAVQDGKDACTCSLPAGSRHVYPCPQWKPE